MVNRFGHWFQVLFGTRFRSPLRVLSGFWGTGFRIPLRGLSGFRVNPELLVLEVTRLFSKKLVEL